MDPCSEIICKFHFGFICHFVSKDVEIKTYYLSVKFEVVCLLPIRMLSTKHILKLKFGIISGQFSFMISRRKKIFLSENLKPG